MITIEQVDLASRKQVARFINLPYRLYTGCPQWVPPLRNEAKRYLTPSQHPFYDHSVADFFIAVENGRDVGRIAALEHRLSNEQHGLRHAHFYFFESENNQEVAGALFNRVAEWAAARNLDAIFGPKGFSMLDGFGILIDGFQHRQMMSLSNYNHAYYPALLEALGFTKAIDLISCYLDGRSFQPPAWFEEVAEWARAESELQVRGFDTMRALLQDGSRILNVYNQAMAQNWEYYPFPEREVKFAIDTVKMISNPRLMKVLYHSDEMVGVFIVFPDLTPALQRAGGNLTPLSIVDLSLAVRRRPLVIAIAALGVLPEYRLRGGNVLLFTELIQSVTDLRVQGAELIQIPDTALEMRRDLAALGIQPHKTHRVYVKHL